MAVAAAPNRQSQVIVPQIPFVAAAHEHTERAFGFQVTPGAAIQNFQFDIPSYGYLRHLWIQFVGSGGTGGTAAADAPWNLISNITLLDTNGAPIFGPLDGYALYWANAIGGYAFQNDPKKIPLFSGTAPNMAFAIRVPVEISHYDGMGSLANQNSAAPYRLSIDINTAANVYSVAPAPATLFTVTGIAEEWSLPNELDGLGRPQAQVPPNHGTVQYWSGRQVAVAVGDNTIPITRVGNLIRNLVFIARNSSGVRTDGVFPDPAILNWDARQIYNDPQNYRNADLVESLSPIVRDTGVFVYPFGNSMMNRNGDDKPTLWLPTVQASRIEAKGIVAVAGNVQVITNDIAPAEVDPTQRYELDNRTGFQPNPDLQPVTR